VREVDSPPTTVAGSTPAIPVGMGVGHRLRRVRETVTRADRPAISARWPAGRANRAIPGPCSGSRRRRREVNPHVTQCDRRAISRAPHSCPAASGHGVGAMVQGCRFRKTPPVDERQATSGKRNAELGGETWRSGGKHRTRVASGAQFRGEPRSWDGVSHGVGSPIRGLPSQDANEHLKSGPFGRGPRGRRTWSRGGSIGRLRPLPAGIDDVIHMPRPGGFAARVTRTCDRDHGFALDTRPAMVLLPVADGRRGLMPLSGQMTVGTASARRGDLHVRISPCRLRRLNHEMASSRVWADAHHSSVPIVHFIFCHSISYAV
jgi:hypothetical protein